MTTAQDALRALETMRYALGREFGNGIYTQQASDIRSYIERTAAPAEPVGKPQKITYTNWRGETAQREIVPRRLWFGSTEWHPAPQWIVSAWDVAKNSDRDFVLAGFGHPDGMALAEKLAEALTAFRRKRDEIEEFLRPFYTLGMSHGITYRGPTYKPVDDLADAALSDFAAAKGGKS